VEIILSLFLIFVAIVFLAALGSRRDPPRHGSKPPDTPAAKPPRPTAQVRQTDRPRPTPSFRPGTPHLCAGSVITGRCWVIDGDTIVIDKQNIRLAGIDAPELDHPWGQKSKFALVALCKGQTIKARVTGELSYDRIVAICHLPDGRDLAAEMVRMGLALDWPTYSGGRYRHLEPANARRRLWRAEARQKGRAPPRTGVGA
jgi:micrococcal nuclease